MNMWDLGLLVILYAAMTHATALGVTLYLHRSQTHRSVILHPALEHCFRFWIWATTGMVTSEWIAVHLKHHAHADEEEDPHSPAFFGLPTVLFRGWRLYQLEASNPDTLKKFGEVRGRKRGPDDRMERYVYSRRPSLGIFALLAMEIALLGWWFGWVGMAAAPIFWLCQMVWIPFWAAGVINGFGHARGYRNFTTPDNSRNILLGLGVVMAGEELHNNHHHASSSANFRARWWEIDAGWLYILLFRRLRLARAIRTARS